MSPSLTSPSRAFPILGSVIAGALSGAAVFGYRWLERERKARLQRAERHLTLFLGGGALGAESSYYRVQAGKWYWMRYRQSIQPVLVLRALDAMVEVITVRRDMNNVPHVVGMTIDPDESDVLEELEFLPFTQPDYTQFDESLVDDLLATVGFSDNGSYLDDDCLDDDM